MMNNAFSESIIRSAWTPEVIDAFMQNMDESVIMFRKFNGVIVYKNEAAERLNHALGIASPSVITDIINEESLNSILDDSITELHIANRVLHVNSFTTDSFILLLIKEYADFMEYAGVPTKSAVTFQEILKEFQSVFYQYADGSTMITDGRGVIEFSGENTAKNCGVDVNYLLGKNVYDMETARIFYPSVTVKVLDTKKSHVIFQTTKNAAQLVSLGIPIINESGHIDKVISITRNYSSQIKIGSLLSKMMQDTGFNSEADKEFDHIVTCTESMFQLKALARLIAKFDSTVLISGETGTGKGVFAQLIHKLSNRKNAPFIKVNCGAIAPQLIESELFGYVPGAFTGANAGGKIGLLEAANHGTVLLDEIGELFPEHQVKLLQAIQERCLVRVGGTQSINLDIRIIAATNNNLETLVAQKRFREDLYYRLNVVPLHILPLRERKEDIPLLTNYFVSYFSKTYSLSKQVSKDALATLCQYTWPGNVRELENTIERLVVTTRESIIKRDDLPERMRDPGDFYQDAVEVKKIISLQKALEETERQLIRLTMEKYGTTTRTAEILGVNQSTISRKLSSYK